MNYIIDAVLVIVFVITVLVSAKKGFFKTLFELGAYVIALIGAKLFSASFAPGIFDGYISDTAESYISGALGQAGTTNYADAINAALDKIPEWVNSLAELIGISKESIAQQVANLDLAGDNAVESIMNAIVTPVGTAIIQTLLFVVIAFVLLAVLKIAVRLLDKTIKKLPAIKQVNSGLGAVLGAVKGIITVILVSLVLGVLSGALGSTVFVDAVNDSMIINLIQGLLTSISGYVV